ncbi:MAG: sodium:calcium antiporter [Elusimicrobia bacterium]|nr:sodium:calcium antiporter [Elusimicrobiota bacterium]
MKNKKLSFIWFALTFLFCLQWLFVHFSHSHINYPLNVILPGLAVLGASFIVTWGAELAELEISQGLAIAFLALIAVLPEYMVDLYFAWTAGKNPAYTAYATANMTGSNRLLLGFGWSLVCFLFWWRSGKKEILLDKSQRIEIFALIVATIYSFIIPMKGTLSLLDSIVLVGIFVLYIFNTAKSHSEEKEIEGPMEIIAALPRNIRIFLTVFFFVFSAYVIFVSAGPFAEGLLVAGERLGLEKFILVQWLAPLASEAPEFIVAIILALRLHASTSLRVLVSSKVNQWTLLIGLLPVAYCISKGQISPMHLDARQIEEILITSGQSLLGLVMLSNLKFNIKEASLLFALFITQLFIISTEVRYIYAVAYIILSLLILIISRSTRENFIKMFTESWFKKSSQSF